MINAETRIALEMIDKLENEGEKLEYLNKLKNLILKEKEKEDVEKEEFQGCHPM